MLCPWFLHQVSIILAQRKEASRKAEEETEGGTRQSGDETGDVTPHVEASDHPMESADVIVLLLLFIIIVVVIFNSINSVISLYYHYFAF